MSTAGTRAASQIVGVVAQPAGLSPAHRHERVVAVRPAEGVGQGQHARRREADRRHHHGARQEDGRGGAVRAQRVVDPHAVRADRGSHRGPGLAEDLCGARQRLGGGVEGGGAPLAVGGDLRAAGRVPQGVAGAGRLADLGRDGADLLLHERQGLDGLGVGLVDGGLRDLVELARDQRGAAGGPGIVEAAGQLGRPADQPVALRVEPIDGALRVGEGIALPERHLQVGAPKWWGRSPAPGNGSSDRPRVRHPNPAVKVA